MIKITSMHEQCVKVNRQNNEELYIYIYIDFIRRNYIFHLFF